MEANVMIPAKTATEAFDSWWEILKAQADSGYKEASRIGDVVGEILNAVTVIENPRKGLCQSSIRNASVEYAIGELLWYLSGSNKLSGIVPYSKAWKNLTDDGLINSAYGHRIQSHFGFDQWEYCLDKLSADPQTRQAVIHIKDASNKSSKDTPCTIALQYSIRQKQKPSGRKFTPEQLKEYMPKLYATTFMRSNDIWLGFPYDVFAFTALQVKMSMELGVDVGTYTHIAGSLHLYKSSLEKATKEVKESEKNIS